MKELFKGVFLINLCRRPDRLASALSQIYDYWPFCYPEIIPAVDGDRDVIPVDWRAGGGAWGCRQSHCGILRKVIAEDLEPVLVLEDDFCVRPTFTEECEQFFRNVPEDWELLMLGGQHFVEPRPVAPGVVRCLNTGRTHAYAVRGQALRDLYGQWSSRLQQVHIDWTMAGMVAGYKSYAPATFIFGQLSSMSDICGRVNPTTYW